MNIFKHRHFKYDIIIWAVRWYCKYGISYRDLEEMLCERGVDVDHCTIYRWVICYGPKILDKLKWYYKPGSGHNWRVDETYIKIKGRWTYLYRALDASGQTIDFYLSSTRNTLAAHRFLRKALKSIPAYAHPKKINTDKNPAYASAITMLKKDNPSYKDIKHQTIKYLNNIIESDHGKLKRLIKPTLGFKSRQTAYATIKGFEVMRMFKKGQMTPWLYGQGVQGEINLITNALLMA